MLDKNDLKEIREIVFRYLDPKKDRVFIFGSRTQTTARKFSDVDVGIKSKRKIELSTLSSIMEAFEESNFPYIVEVVDFSTVSRKFQQVAERGIIPLN